MQKTIPQLPALDRPAGENIAAGGEQYWRYTVRNDTGVQEGGEISIYYDPMIAKLVTQCAVARRGHPRRRRSALDSFYIDGIRHNIPFLSALMLHPRWREGNLSTGFNRGRVPGGFCGSHPRRRDRPKLAAVAAAIDHVLANASGRYPAS